MACKYTFAGKEYTEQEFKSFVNNNFVNQPKTLMLFEQQSDLFQKGRDNKELVQRKANFNQLTEEEEIERDELIRKYNQPESDEDTATFSQERLNELNEKLTSNKEQIYGNENQFLQLLNKDNNWVTFFVKAIVQSTAKETIQEVDKNDVENMVRQLEREGKLKIDCKGKIKAEKGLSTSFTKGGKWKVIKDLKDYPTHKEGGVDLTIGKSGVSIKNGNTQFTAKYGLVLPKN